MLDRIYQTLIRFPPLACVETSRWLRFRNETIQYPIPYTATRGKEDLLSMPTRQPPPQLQHHMVILTDIVPAMLEQTGQFLEPCPTVRTLPRPALMLEPTRILGPLAKHLVAEVFVHDVLPLVNHGCRLVDVFVIDTRGADALFKVADHVAVAPEGLVAAVAFDVSWEMDDFVLFVVSECD